MNYYGNYECVCVRKRICECTEIRRNNCFAVFNETNCGEFFFFSLMSHQIFSTGNSDNSTSLDKDTSVEEKDSKESTSSGEDSEELTTISVSTVSSTTMNYEETTTDLIFIDETSTTSDSIPSTTSTIASTSTKSQSITTDDIYDGSGSGKVIFESH